MDMDSDEEAAWLEEEKAIEAEEAAKTAQLVEEEETARKRAHLEANVLEIFDLANVVADPGLRRPIAEYGTPEIRDKMRWAYLSRGRTRLIGHNLMICYVEKEIFAKIDDKKIMLRFHSYNDRRGHLPRHFRLANMDTT